MWNQRIRGLLLLPCGRHGGASVLQKYRLVDRTIVPFQQQLHWRRYRIYWVSPSLPLTLSLFLSLSGFHLTRTYALTLSILISRVGCDGVPNSGKTNDECGVCDGDGSSCSGWSRVCLHARVYACGLHYRCIVFHVCTRACVRVIGCAFLSSSSSFSSSTASFFA